MNNRLTATLVPNAALEHERLSSLINSMADGVIAVDENVRVVIYNGAALNILDRNSSMQGDRLSDHFRPINKSGHYVDLDELVRSAKLPTASRDLRIRYSDGSFVNLYLSIAPVHLSYGARGDRGYVLLLRDITREKSLEDERNEFISVVSHELRTPIAIAEGNVSNAEFLAHKTNDTDQIKSALSEAHNQILFLADLINDLSTLSRAERGKLMIEPEIIDVQQLMQKLVVSYMPQAQQKGLVLKSDVEPNIPTLHSSSLYVREILQNFVTNALKYTEEGSITIHAKAAQGGIEFSVEDTGIGISKTDQSKVFDKFFRSEDYRTRETNGTGLGLYVTAKLAKLLHASIGLQSELNHGSRFTIFVPDLTVQ